MTQDPIPATGRKFWRFLPRLRAATALSAALIVTTPIGVGGQVLTDSGLNLYGLPGAIDTPSAEMMTDGTLAGHFSRSRLARRQGLSFQFHPRMAAALRYGRAEGYDLKRGHLWDRSFDLRWQVFGEQGWRPAVAVGLQDFIGTGVYGAEYIVATKTLTPRIRASFGLDSGLEYPTYVDLRRAHPPRKPHALHTCCTLFVLL